MMGIITDIKRFAVHDGDGIRTTVFFKGCPLECIWCHNPEGLSALTEIGYYAHKCKSCGLCTKLCPANKITDGVHVFLREKCDLCGKCTERCPAEAFALYGRRVTPTELMPKLIEDRDFYESSGGGITLSGGECLLQADFAEELLRLCKSERLNTAVDTCGFVPWSAFEKVIPYTDVFLYDIKAADPDVHKKCTGRTNEPILENLKRLDSLGCKIEVRIPFVPGYNDKELPKIREILLSLKNIIGVRVLPYHNYAGSKYSAIGRFNSLPEALPNVRDQKEAEELFGDLLIR